MGKGAVGGATGIAKSDKEALQELKTFMSDINKQVDSLRMTEEQVVAASNNLSPRAKEFFEAMKKWHDDPNKHVYMMRAQDDGRMNDPKVQKALDELKLSLKAMPYFKGSLYRYLEGEQFGKMKPGETLSLMGLSSFAKADGDFMGNAFVNKMNRFVRGNEGVLLLWKNGIGRQITAIEPEQREVMTPNGTFKIVANKVTTMQEARHTFAEYSSNQLQIIPPRLAQKGTDDYDMMREKIRVLEIERVSGNKDF